MKFDGREFDVSANHYDEFFKVMDSLEKVVLTKDIKADGIKEYDKEKYFLYEVSNHAILLPRSALVKFDELVDYC